MRFASIAFVKHVVKHTVYKRSRQGCTPDPHRNQKSGSPCPITPPELETLPHAGPRGDHPGARGRGAPLSQRIARFLYTTPLAGLRCVALGLRRVGGYRGNEIFFMCRVLCASGSPYSANESFFSIDIFRRFRRGKGPFPAGRTPFPPVRGERPSPGLHRPLRACVRELSRMSRNTTSKAVSDRPAFFDGGSRYRPGKGKRLPTFFTPKSEVFCGVAEPLAGFSLGGPVKLSEAPSLFRL